MQGSVRKASRPVTWALTLAFAVALSGNCLIGAKTTEAQMACCATMGEECGHQAQDAGCCPTEPQNVDQVAAAKRMATPLPQAVTTPSGVVVATIQHTCALGGRSFDGFTPKPPGVPKYLLVSTLLI